MNILPRLIPLLAAAIAVLTASAAPAGPVPAGRGPALPAASQPRTNPAVARIIATDRDGYSCGSGTLVAASGDRGLVVTNWHVVSDARGPITVVFPDGFRSGAVVLKTDRDWDLAALAIRRPPVEPVPIAGAAPRPGEPLTIAGYGPGWYREATGRCTQYVSPGGNRPFEMVELSAGARHGDSGGPILNGRGELAGVLFGAAGRTTTGSYCGRVRWFLASVMDDYRPDRLQQPDGTMIARRPDVAVPSPTTPGHGHVNRLPPARPQADALAGGGQTARTGPPTVSIAVPSPPTSQRGKAGGTGDSPGAGWHPSPSPGGPEIGQGDLPSAESGAGAAADGPSRFEQIKTFLAFIGGILLLFHGLRVVAAIQGPVSHDK